MPSSERSSACSWTSDWRKTMLRSGSTPTAIQSATISRALSPDVPHVLVRRRERVEVDDAVDAVVVVLQAHPVAQGAEEVADVELAGGAHAGEDALPGGGHLGMLPTPGSAPGGGP